MLKNFLTIIITFSTFAAYSQINNSDINMRRGPCFLKSFERIGQQYAEWECDDFDNIVDCNESLEAVPGANVVFSRTGGQPFTGTCETCHMNGLREHLISFDDGRVVGTDTSYYQTGCPQVVRTHIDGVENGRWTYFNDSSGLIAWEINYNNGEKHGQSIFFRQHQVGTDKITIEVDGKIESHTYGIYENDTIKIENHNNGILQGTKKEYYFPGSKLRREVNYTQGILDGAFIEYNFEGDVLQELNYILGQKDGLWKYYYDNGSLLKTENWKKDIKEGEFKTFYIQGTIQSIENYRKGQKHGEFIERFPDDKIKREAIYRKDVLIEEHIYDKYGNEISTVGGEANTNDEDDDLPKTEKKKKQKKQKKQKKSKNKEQG